RSPTHTPTHPATQWSRCPPRPPRTLNRRPARCRVQVRRPPTPEAMGRNLNSERFVEQLASAKALAPCTVICGDEILLATEAGDALRTAAARLGCTERTRLVMDARSDWSLALAATQNTSLFGDQHLIEISLPTGKPGKTGGETL